LWIFHLLHLSTLHSIFYTIYLSGSDIYI
jgi:hypothetical protein